MLSDKLCVLTTSRNGLPLVGIKSYLGIGIQMRLSYFTGFHFDLERPKTEESLVRD